MKREFDHSQAKIPVKFKLLNPPSDVKFEILNLEPTKRPRYRNHKIRYGQVSEPRANIYEKENFDKRAEMANSIVHRLDRISQRSKLQSFIHMSERRNTLVK
jgi:hypothetical protein